MFSFYSYRISFPNIKGGLKGWVYGDFEITFYSFKTVVIFRLNSKLQIFTEPRSSIEENVIYYGSNTFPAMCE